VATLEALGWNSFFAVQARRFPDLEPARVTVEHKHFYRVMLQGGELRAEVAGRLRHQATGREGFPAVGDWVLVQPRPLEQRATIHRVLDRRSKISRKVAGLETQEQILAANINTAFLLQSLNRDFNARRLERYLTMVWDSGASPVVLLTKQDLCLDVRPFLDQVEAIAGGVAVHALSAITGDGLESLDPYLRIGESVVMLGSSGVGKSTLVNRLAGADLLEVQEIRDDDARGRHTTAQRQLILLPRGSIVIDTPGLRELQLWTAGFDRTFTDIEELAHECRFRDCKHEAEPGCRVRTALEEGVLDPARFQSYRKLGAEMKYLERRRDAFSRAKEKEKWKKIHRAYNRMMRERGR
jgi:ribosome biogenesis GTPase / thiamine phosphate phosphatase